MLHCKNPVCVPNTLCRRCRRQDTPVLRACLGCSSTIEINNKRIKNFCPKCQKNGMRLIVLGGRGTTAP